MGQVLCILALMVAAGLWVVPAPASGGRSRWRRRRRLSRRAAPDPAAEVGAVLVAAAARLRAGQTPHEAWRASLAGRPPAVVAGFTHVLQGRSGIPAGIGPQTHAALRSAHVASDVARTLGAELAPVLASCAAGIEEAARAAAERTAAFAGPRATARLLLALPAAGVLLGAVMGADPLRIFTTTLGGGALLALAGGLMLAGRWWIRELIQRAERGERE